MNKIAIYTATIVSILVFVVGCNDDKSEIDMDHDILAEEAISDFESYRFQLNLSDSEKIEFPSPLEAAREFKKAGIEYFPHLTNDAKNSENYFVNTKKALNFGVYSADLSYCVLNNQGQRASEYFVVLKKISNEIGLGEIFKYELVLSNFNSSLGDRDVMSALVNGIQRDLDVILKANGARDKFILFYTGAWIENAYIAVNASKNFSNVVDTSIAIQVSNQIALLDEILEKYEEIKDKNEDVLMLQNKLYEFSDIFSSIRVTSLGDSLVLDIRDLNKIKQKIEEIRAYVIS